MNFTIQSPAGMEEKKSNVDAVRAILSDGKPLTILPKHAPLMAEVGTDAITIAADNGESAFTVKHGILMVAEDNVTVLTTGMLMQEENDA